MNKCELFEKCGFFSRYRKTSNVACRGFIALYCKGPKLNECKRKEYMQQHGQPPEDNMLPNGYLTSK